MPAGGSCRPPCVPPRPFGVTDTFWLPRSIRLRTAGSTCPCSTPPPHATCSIASAMPRSSTSWPTVSPARSTASAASLAASTLSSRTRGSSSMRRPMPASSRRSAQYPRFTWRWTASLWVSSAFMTPSSRAFPRLWRSCAVWASGTSSCSPATTSAQLRLWPLRRASPSSAQTCFPNRSTHTYRLDAAEVVEAQDVEAVEG